MSKGKVRQTECGSETNDKACAGDKAKVELGRK
jgi:hypothetical protein